MADDIDIEEHDVLDNPAIRNIFPDISVIKEEISKYYEDVPNVKREPEIAAVPKKILEDAVTTINADENGKHDTQKYFSKTNISRETPNKSGSKSNKWENPSYGSKIIIGSKSESQSLKWEKPFQGTKIILGSKPNKVVEHVQEDINVNKEQNISLNSVVRIPKLFLQDLGEYIYQSNRYCEDCKTLFPSKYEFSDHKLKSHSTKQELQKPIVTVSSKTTSVNNKNKCSVCSLKFSSRSSLSRHYKNVHKKILVSNDNKIKASHTTSIKDAKRIRNKSHFNNDNIDRNFRQTRNKQLNLKVTLENKTVKKSLNKTYLNMCNKQKNTSSKKNTCTICGKHYSDKSNLYRHYRIVHKKAYSVREQKDIEPPYSANRSSCKTSMNKQKRENDNLDTRNKCFHCDEEFPDKSCLIEHMYTILEPKHPTQKHSQTVTKAKGLLDHIKEPTNSEHCNTKKKGIKMKDKLIFENQDSDESESSKKYNEIKNKDNNTKIKSSEKNMTSTTLKHKQTDGVKKSICSLSEVESQTLELSPKNFENKGNDDWSGDDDDEDWNLSGGSNENYSSDESNFMNKKQKTENKDSKVYKSKKSGLKIIVKKSENMMNIKQKKKLKTKKVKPKNRLLTRISKNKSVGIQPSATNKISLQSVFVYECVYCSYICSTPRAYCMHVWGKHRVENVSQVNKAIFEKQCKFCPYRTSKKSHNRHLRLCHYNLLYKPHRDETDKQDGPWQKKPTEFKISDFNKVESFVLKSIVYKCNKCDLHFLSSCVAKDHEKHMELLVNWKCSICKKIFKIHDKQLHLKQHKFTKTVNVCQFDESELSKLLYNCTKCGIHFTEERYLEHYSQCGNQTTDSVYCKKCDILIDTRGYDEHLRVSHSTGKDTDNIVVITGDIITKTRENDNNLVESNSRKELSSHEEKDEIETVASSTIYKPMNCLTFCQFCKCYLSDIAVNRKSHIEGLCAKMVRYTCPTCGLVFSNKTITTHRDHHKKQKGLKLHDFEFFDLKGIQIRPPIPEYPSCNNCDVIFVGRNTVKTHLCSETEYLTCEICNVKLSESAFKLHMSFHSYRMPNEKTDQLIYIAPRESQQNCIEPEEHVKTLNPDINAVLPKTSELKTIVQMNSQENNYKTNLNKSSSVSCNMLKENTNNSRSTETIESQLKQSLSNTAEIERNGINDNSPRRNLVLYTCQSCNISIETYDKVILHCQNHFSPNPEKLSSFEICSKCSLKFEIASIETHEKVHLDCDMSQVLLNITFDPTYFTSDNNIWINHIFASASPSVKHEAIEKSMYQQECRIKIEVVQQGPTYLTVYKCYKCVTFIDPDCLISHIKDGCNRNMGKYPCSLCGLPFISCSSRTKHETIHKEYENVRLKSYNILLFNCESHATYNSSILKAMEQYVLYQCRTCDGIVNKLQRNHHKCNVEDLRKCLICGLMLYKDDFDWHVHKHSDLALYNTDNIKVILFGDKVKKVFHKELSSSFKGFVCDFKLYKCNECHECENDDKSTTRHVCKFDDSKWKCPRCGLNISARSIKHHIKKHDFDAEFHMDNLMIVNFDPNKVKGKTVDHIETHGGNNDNQSLNTRLPQIKASHTDHENDHTKAPLREHIGVNSKNSVDDDQSTKLTTLYKCTCGLHYMEEMLAKNHAKLCCPNMKIIRQNCSKCSLTFNPKELFTHILAHHGDKNKTFKYKVIDIKAPRYKITE